jgi:hypothetical protein
MGSLALRKQIVELQTIQSILDIYLIQHRLNNTPDRFITKNDQMSTKSGSSYKVQVPTRYLNEPLS